MWRTRGKPDKASQLAMVKAQSALEETRKRGPAVHEVVAQLKLIRERNHFAERLQHIIEGAK